MHPYLSGEVGIGHVVRVLPSLQLPWEVDVLTLPVSYGKGATSDLSHWISAFFVGIAGKLASLSQQGYLVLVAE